jgi:uncharacterized protein with PQ loop repeat
MASVLRLSIATCLALSVFLLYSTRTNCIAYFNIVGLIGYALVLENPALSLTNTNKPQMPLNFIKSVSIIGGLLILIGKQQDLNEVEEDKSKEKKD